MNSLGDVVGGVRDGVDDRADDRVGSGGRPGSERKRVNSMRENDAMQTRLTL